MRASMYIFINRGLDMSPGKIAAQAGHAATEAALISHPQLVQPDHSPNLSQYQNGVYTPGLDPHASDLKKFIDLWYAWREGLHYAKYVMEARDNEHIMFIERYLNERGFRTALILDEGHTEIDPIQPTALGVALVDRDDPHTEATFSSFKLYRDKRPSQLVARAQAYEVYRLGRIEESVRRARQRLKARSLG